MSGPELAAAAEALFGASWRVAAAAALGISRETLWRHVAAAPPREVAAAMAAWRRLARHGVAPPPSPEASFPTLPAEAPCQEPVVSETLAGVAADAFGPGWRDEVCATCGLSRNGLWRQIAMGRVSGPVGAWLRAVRALAVLEPRAPAAAASRGGRCRRPSGHAPRRA